MDIGDEIASVSEESRISELGLAWAPTKIRFRARLELGFDTKCLGSIHSALCQCSGAKARSCPLTLHSSPYGLVSFSSICPCSFLHNSPTHQIRGLYPKQGHCQVVGGQSPEKTTGIQNKFILWKPSPKFVCQRYVFKSRRMLGKASLKGPSQKKMQLNYGLLP